MVAPKSKPAMRPQKFTRLTSQVFPQVQKETVVNDYILVKSGAKHHKVILDEIM